MADRDDKPRAHVIEPARSGRSRCQSCEQPIANGELRLSEAFVTDEGRWARAHHYARTPRPRGYDSDDRDRNYDSVNPDVVARFHHLACAAAHEPYKLRSALAACTLEIADRDALDQAIERSLSVVDAAQEDATTRDDYERFIAEARDAHDDEALIVFADWLQSVNDPRGELSAIHRALETATVDNRAQLAAAEKKLLAAHRKRFLPDRLGGKLVWRHGFVHRVVVPATGVDAASLAREFAHPSFRLLRELEVSRENSYATGVAAANLPTPLPATLRVLELGDDQLGLIGPLVADALPQLERLRLRGAGELEGVRHPTLAELELACFDAALPALAMPRGERRTLAARIAVLARHSLPGLRRIVLRVDRNLDVAVGALAQTDLLHDLDRLTLHGDLTHAGITHLVQARRASIRSIDVAGCRLAGVEVDRLELVAETVVRPQLAIAPPAPPPPAIKDWLVRHTRKPEWGIGRVVTEGDDGLQVEFEHGGIKHVRNVELLEEVDG